MARAAERAAMVDLTDRDQSSWLVLVWVLLMVLGYSVGPVVLGVGLALRLPGSRCPAPGRRCGARRAGRGALASGGGFALTLAGMSLVAVRVCGRARGSLTPRERQGLAV